MDNQTARKTHNRLHIVGVGGSAGGLRPFTELLQATPKDTGIAYVFVEHLDPKQASLLPEILAKVAAIPVVEVTTPTKVRANYIYTMPSDRDLTITDGTLHLIARRNRSGIHKPIDTFLASLAKDQSELAIGVILSGSGTDGTAGLKAVKAHGGATFAQDETAEFSAMPQSAVQAEVVDFILPPRKIAQKIIQLNRDSTAGETVIYSILALLKARAGIDFVGYKSATVQRRIRRRMILNHVKSLGEYHKLLTTNPTELGALQKDMLIHVTRFFRDSEQFQVLQKTVFPAILKNRSGNEPINIWVPGCASGEEAYSIAIAFIEFLGRKKVIPFKVLGTDISEDMIDKAHQGLYRGSIRERVSPKRLQQFFTKVKNGYQVKKAVMDVCQFVVQDVSDSPPIEHVDLISCQNVLIYLGPDLQQKVFLRLHSALQPDGFLVLGRSEGIGASTDLFRSLDIKHRVYTKDTTGGKPSASPGTPGTLQKTINTMLDMDAPIDSQNIIEDTSFVPSGTGEQVDRQQKVTKLREALSLAQEYADSIIGELGVMNEEMQSSNVELMTINEEAQTANEELTTARVEQQAGNEALKTISQELETRNEGMTLARDYAEAIIKTVREPLIILDGKLRVKSASKSFYTTFKVTPMQTENILLYDLGNREWDIPKLRTLLEKTLPKNNTFTDYEVVHDFKDIGKKTMLLNARTLQQGPDKMPLILLAIEDITDRKQAEEALMESEDLFRTANEKMTILNEELQIKTEDVTVALDYADAIIRTVRGPLLVLSKDLRIISANEAFYNAFKVTPKQTENILLYDLGNRQWNIPRLKTLLEKILPKNNTLTDYEVVHDFKDIGQKTMLLNARTLQQGPDKTSLILLAIEDITERKQLEQQKDEFMRIASHELKTPVTSIKAYAQIMQRRFERQKDDESAKNMARMNAQLDKLTGLIGDLLDVTKIEAGKMQFQIQSFDFDELVMEMAETMQLTSEQHRIIVQGRAGKQAWGDRERTGQVLTNLIGNAIKYSPQSDKIKVTVKSSATEITTCVQDFGLGVSREKQEQVFERFFRVSGPSMESFSGLGLGLYISAEIVRRLGGKIWVKSTEGKGSMFCFTLPLNMKVATTQEANTAASAEAMKDE